VRGSHERRARSNAQSKSVKADRPRIHGDDSPVAQQIAIHEKTVEKNLDASFGHASHIANLLSA
jgi:hypothetical protein